MQRMGGEVQKEPALATDDRDDLAGQRKLLTVAVRNYEDIDEDDADEFAAGIDEQLEVVAQWWGPNGLTPGFHQLPMPDLTCREDVEDLLRREDVREMQGHALVVFITGHGIPGTSGTHFLKLPESVKRRNLATAARTSDIVMAALDSHVENVLVIVNACYAAKLNTELGRLLSEVGPDRQDRCQLDVLVTCDHNQTVEVRRFPTTLRRVFERLRTKAGITAPYLSVEEFRAEYARAIPNQADRRRYRLRRLVDGSGHDPSPCLPNPGYLHIRDLIGADYRQATAADGYWLDRATGRTQESDTGWYFRGRHALNRKVAAFLGPQRPRGVLLVTGSTGSGKSAVVARAVVLSNPQFRSDPLYKEATDLVDTDTIPPEGAVTAAVLAHRRDAATVASDILRGVGITPLPPGPADDPVLCWTGQLRKFVSSAEHPVTLVIDGLDEALERHRVIHDVLAPLGEFCQPSGQVPVPRREDDPPAVGPAVRLLIGIRSTRPPAGDGAQAAGDDHGLLQALRQVFPLAEVERTDGEDAQQDIEDYLYALISADGNQSTAREAALLVAPVLSPWFIHARLAGEQLRTVPDAAELAGQETWQAMLRQGIRGLLVRDLELVEEDEHGLPREIALALLRASAFAQGAGVPWSDVWPQMAGVFLGRRLPAEDWDASIGKLLAGRLSGYLAHDHEDNRLVYRPAHEALADVLMNTDDDLLDLGSVR
ncbi:ATP-binding protein (plasmid) [Streptomyces sp. NBC_00868]|uniref:ATP-binding protein n=1 Tax=Streptomyces sp. NBC_00868 TaxID=2903683 RepID=UPI002F90681D|nr:ATP-binding protein [Streptomyces sp. NBC_00868]